MFKSMISKLFLAFPESKIHQIQLYHRGRGHYIRVVEEFPKHSLSWGALELTKKRAVLPQDTASPWQSKPATSRRCGQLPQTVDVGLSGIINRLRGSHGRMRGAV